MIRTFVIFLSLMASNPSYSQSLENLNIEIPSNDTTVELILQHMEKQYGILFSYVTGEIPLKAKVRLTGHSLSLSNLLREMFNGKNIEYSIVSKQIILRKKKNLKCTISGFVKEHVSNELLIGAYVYLPELKIGTMTNAFGFYSLTIPQKDSLIVAFSSIGYERFQTIINTLIINDLDVFLKTDTSILEAVLVSSSLKQSETVRMSNINLPVAQMKNMPSLLGEKDVFKTLQLMPGIKKGSEGSSGIYVRGGGADHNLIILDDAIVYNSSHAFGFISLFNGDAIKSVEITKGGFSARYGGRLSSVIDMSLKEGNKEETHGEAAIGLISSRFVIETPLKRNKSSVLFSGRRTYFDLLTMPFMNKDQGYFKYYFYDLNGKINYDFGSKNKLYLSGYFGKDYFAMSEVPEDQGGTYWGNVTTTLRWNHLFSNKIFANTSVIFSDYKFTMFNDRYYRDLDETKSIKYFSRISDGTLKYDMDIIPGHKHFFKAGLVGIFHHFQPNAFIQENINKDEIINNIYNLETGVYCEDTWQPLYKMKINAGVRYSEFLTKNNSYFSLEPRLSAAWKFDNNIAVKASYAKMNQYIHMLSNTGLSLPTDLWVPATNKVKPQQSQQIAGGIVKDIEKPDISFSIEGYYKIMNNIIGYKEGMSFLETYKNTTKPDQNWEDNVTSGQGWSYGAEFFLHKKEGKLSGWLGYTLSWTQMQFDSLNFGRKFYAGYDRRHDISLVCLYSINNKVNISFSWVYGTGNRVTLPLSEYPRFEYNPGNNLSKINDNVNEIKINEYGGMNNFKVSDYHRLDFGIQFRKKIRGGLRTWEISVYNVYNRQNPFYYFIQTDYETNDKKLNQVSLFPFIPSVIYSIKF